MTRVLNTNKVNYFQLKRLKGLVSKSLKKIKKLLNFEFGLLQDFF
jgi:hypothetical protein